MASTRTGRLGRIRAAWSAQARGATRHLGACRIGLTLGAAACSSHSIDIYEVPDNANPVMDCASGTAPLTDTEVFDPKQELRVSVDMEPKHFERLREEGRSVLRVQGAEPDDFEYTRFPATVIINGRRIEGATVRKKGYLGSLSRLRPSLKLYFKDASWCGEPVEVKRLTLNNNRQDPTHARQCLSYGLFERAGVPAPRCNLAHVTVNGKSLGSYSNVETIRAPMLERFFSDTSGNLYEGQLRDLTPEDLPHLQLKTNEKENDRSDIERFAEALATDSDGWLEQLAQVVDLDRFITFWAMETLTGHWDSYSGNQNNYWMYSDPVSQRLHFIPWGTDGTFEVNPPDTQNPSPAVYAHGLLANRLYSDAAQRERYRERLRELTKELWDEPALLAELDFWTQLARNPRSASVEELKDYLQSHGTQILKALQDPAPTWVDRALADDPCHDQLQDVRIRFSGPYTDLSGEPSDVELEPTHVEIDMTLDGKAVVADWQGSIGHDPRGSEPGVFIRALTSFEDGSALFVQINTPAAEFAPGSHPLHGFETSGIVVLLGEPARFMGFIGDGTLELDAAERRVSAPVRGELNGRLLQQECANLATTEQQ